MKAIWFIFPFFLLSFFDCWEALGVRCCFPLSGQRREQPGLGAAAGLSRGAAGAGAGGAGQVSAG